MGWVRRIRRLPAWLGTVPGRFAVALAFVVILTPAMIRVFGWK